MEKELPELKVSMLGRFSMTYGEQTVSFKRNTATKAVKLLQILLHESFCGSGEQAGIPRTELLEDLFGREELSNVANNLRVTVHRLKKMLVEAGLPEYDYIKIENGIYRWDSPMKVRIDVADFWICCKRRRRKQRNGRRWTSFPVPAVFTAGNFFRHCRGRIG